MVASDTPKEVKNPRAHRSYAQSGTIAPRDAEAREREMPEPSKSAEVRSERR